MGKLIRCITDDGLVMAAGVDSTDICAAAERIHKTSAVVTAALGRLLTAASLMGNALKGEGNTLTIKISGDGPIGSLTAAADSHGNVRGYAVHPLIELPLKPNGKLDVSGAVGRTGTLSVVKDLGLREPYSGFVPLCSGEIAEDITAYYAESEQIPTICALGVLVNPDLTVRKAGGYLIQLLPAAVGDEAVISRLEETLKTLRPVTAMLDSGMEIDAIVREALTGFNTEVLSAENAAYLCNCSRERTERVLGSLKAEELLKMAEESPRTEVQCHFCEKTYIFTPEELKKIAKRQKRT